MEENKTFEQSLKQLDEIVEKLQNGDVELETAYSLFEQGMKISKECEEKLTNIEAKLAKILQDNQLEDLNLEDNESSNG